MDASRGLEIVRRLVPVPIDKTLVSVDVEGFRRDFHTDLPADYLALMEEYGLGIWFHDIYLRPSIIRSHLEYEYEILPLADVDVRRGAEGRYLPFGRGLSGEVFLWDTSDGSPDDWGVAVWNGDLWHEGAGGIAGLFGKLLTGEDCDTSWAQMVYEEWIVAEDFPPGEPPHFLPIAEARYE